jgi:GMP synthase (glutamine-hydrolysing)
MARTNSPCTSRPWAGWNREVPRGTCGVLTHVECEGPGRWGDQLDEYGLDVLRFRLSDGESVPDLQAFEMALVLGGPMNVDEDAKYPWLVREKEVIADAVRAGMPILGSCFGSQLVARSLGAVVTKNPVKEIGWHLVTLTPEGQQDPLFADVPAMLPTFQWHGDTFAIPEGAVHLARSTVCENQAFRFGERTYGLPFHVEITTPMVREWFAEYAVEAAAELPPGAPERAYQQAMEIDAENTLLARRILDSFLGIAGFASR